MELSSSLRGIVKLVQNKEVNRSPKIGKVLLTLDRSESAFGIEESGGAYAGWNLRKMVVWVEP